MGRNDYKDWIKLVSIKGLGYNRIRRLLKVYKKPANIFKADKKSLSELTFITDNIVEEIKAPLKDIYLRNQLDLLERYKIKIINILDKDYPDLLKFIYNPPILLYIKGTLKPEDNLAFAIVGTRKPSYYGKKFTQEIGRELSKAGFTLVSGLAYGIDREAHYAALNSGGRTIAVCGTGLDTIYPYANRDLANEIIKNGSLISEYPPGTKIEAWNFPTRNRIISGLSKGVLVIEGKKTSGALITSKMALEQNRDIFALPGNIDSELSEGPNYLIKLGAKIVTCANDIIEDYKVQLRFSPTKEKDKKEKMISLKMSKDEQKVYKLLLQNEKNMTLDQMVNKSDYSAGDLSSILLSLEIKGIIKRAAQNRYWIV